MERKRSSHSSHPTSQQQEFFINNQDDNNTINIGIGQNTQEAEVKVESTAATSDQDGDHITPATGQTSSFSFRSLPARKKWTCIAMAFANFAACTCFSLLAPFFPAEAAKKGASQTVIGLIFSTFELWIVLASPIYGNFITRIGSRFMFLSGLCVCGSCCVLFGLLDKCPPGMIFVVMCFLVRSMEALGTAAFITASFAIIANEFPDNVSTVFGTLETFSGLGLMVGPPIGGALYELGGYGVPFWVMGSLLILCAVLIMFLLPFQQDNPRPDRGSIFRLLTSPLVLVTCINIISGSFSLGFLDPTLAGHLKQFNLSTALVGLVFIVAPGIYAATAPLWGYLSDSKGISYPLIIMGNAVAVVSFLMIGPSPLLPFLKLELWLVIVSLALGGLGIGCALVCTLKCLMNGARHVGFEDSMDSFGMVSGLFNSAFSLGTFIGPTVGSAILEHNGFDWAATVTAGVFAFSMVTFLLYAVLEKSYQKCCRCHSYSLHVDESDDLSRQALRPGSAVSYNSMSSSTVAFASNGSVTAPDNV